MLYCLHPIAQVPCDEHDPFDGGLSMRVYGHVGMIQDNLQHLGMIQGGIMSDGSRGRSIPMR